jgi:hypothetical protein
MTLKIYKKSEKVWQFVDSLLGEFIPSRFSVNTLNNNVTIVFRDGADSRTFSVLEVELYDIGAVSPFPTFATAESLMAKLEEMDCPCFFIDGEYIFVPLSWVSSDEDNALEIGTDGKFYVAPSSGDFKISDVSQMPLIPHTGTTALTIISAYLIPSSTFSNNLHLSIKNSMYTKIGTAGALAIRHYISPSPTGIVGAVQLSLHSGATSNRHTQVVRDVIFREGILYSFPLSTATNDKTVSNATTNISAVPLDFTTTDYYFVTVLALSNSTDSVVQQGLLVEFKEN